VCREVHTYSILAIRWYNIVMSETITLAAGCFWCYQPIFEMLKGVTEVRVGYSGGDFENPTYDDITTGQTGHAEAIEVTFDPAIISLEEIFDAFWAVHNPTTLNQQGNDVGTQYRSAIFYKDEAQREVAEESKAAAQLWLDEPIVTEITPFKNFYPAENYHQNFYAENPNQPYCQMIIDPKVVKFRQKFAAKLKSSVSY
jgi:peptide-methionine (S)-S-oxide reductase